MIERGDTVVCTRDEWVNAFGEEFHSLHSGMVLTVSDTLSIAGTRFLAFSEIGERQFFLINGFRPRMAS